MKIKSISLQHTNPSMGPHETITTVTLQVTADTTSRTAQFINESMVNNTVSLVEYLTARQANDKAILDQVAQNAPNGRLKEGATISNLFFYFEDGQAIELYDVYRCFSVSNFYPDFTKYMVKEGTLSRRSGWFDDAFEKPLKPLNSTEEDSLFSD